MDFRFFNCGSVWLLRANTSAARAWEAEYLDPEALRWAGAVVVEPRYVHLLLQGITGDGFTVEISDEVALSA